jgi:hypothetical protein
MSVKFSSLHLWQTWQFGWIAELSRHVHSIYKFLSSIRCLYLAFIIYRKKFLIQGTLCSSSCGCYVENDIILSFLLFSKRRFCNIIQYCAVAPGRKPIRILNGKLASYKNILKINPLQFYFQLVTCDDWGKYC